MLRRNFLKSLIAAGYLLNNPRASTANAFCKFNENQTIFRDHVNITAMKWDEEGEAFSIFPDTISCLYGSEFSASGMDINSLAPSLAGKRIEISGDRQYVRGAGINLVVDRQGESLLRDYMQDALAVFITPGMRVGTDMEAMTAISRIAREMKGLLTVAVVPTPCYYKDHSLCPKLDEGLSLLKKHVDCCIHVPIAGPVDRETLLSKAFPNSEDAARLTVQAITDTFCVPSLIGIEFWDFQRFVRFKGQTCVGIGVARGKDRASQAAHGAVYNLKRIISHKDSKDIGSIFVNVTAEYEVTLQEADHAIQIIEREIGTDEIYFLHGISSVRFI